MPTPSTAPTNIDYYTDILCVWAWIAQPRLEELQRQWGDKIRIRHRYFDVFGDSHTKISQRWGPHDAFKEFGKHVALSAAPFPDTPVHPEIWQRVRPRSSLSAHLFLKAVGCVDGDEMVQTMASRVRRAFFVDNRDVSQLPLLLELAQEQKLDPRLLEEKLMDGNAMVGLSNDQQVARELGVRGSPTWVLNEGRQSLYGNVGYRILSANIEELRKRPSTEASWC